MKGSKSPALASLALIALTALAYAPAYHAAFIWDDSEYILDNKNLDSPAGLARIWLQPGATPQYYPLTFTTFWIEHHLWGANPAGYHIVNIALHAAAALALWRLLRKLRVPGAYLAAALFALHPITVESVAWISERKNVLSTLLALLAVDAALTWFAMKHAQFAPTDTPLVELRRSPFGAREHLFIALLAYAAALLAKTAVCTLPVVLLILIWWRTGRLHPRDVRDFAPFFVLSLVAVITIYMETRHIGAAGADFAFSPIDRLLIASRAICFYAAKLAWPFPLVFIYPRWAINPASSAQWLYPITVTAALAALFLARRQLGRGPLAAALIYIILLTPTLGFININFMLFSFVADHFAYLPAIPLLPLAAAGITLLLRDQRRVVLPVATALCAFLVFLTFRHARLYQSPEKLWTHTLSNNPHSPVAHAALGFALQQRGAADESIAQYDAALQQTPLDPSALYNLANIAAARPNRASNVLAIYAAAANLDPKNPHVPYLTGLLLTATNHSDEAITNYERAIALEPNFAAAYSNLGGALMHKDRYPEAAQALDRAIQLQPDLFEAQLQLAVALTKLGRNAEALNHYRAAAALNPTHAEAQSLLREAESRNSVRPHSSNK